MNGASSTSHAAGDEMMVDDATVTSTDIGCSNGGIHVIDSLVLPKWVDGGSGASSRSPARAAPGASPDRLPSHTDNFSRCAIFSACVH